MNEFSTTSLQRIWNYLKFKWLFSEIFDIGELENLDLCEANSLTDLLRTKRFFWFSLNEAIVKDLDVFLGLFKFCFDDFSICSMILPFKFSLASFNFSLALAENWESFSCLISTTFGDFGEDSSIRSSTILFSTMVFLVSSVWFSWFWDSSFYTSILWSLKYLSARRESYNSLLFIFISFFLEYISGFCLSLESKRLSLSPIGSIAWWSYGFSFTTYELTAWN